MHPLFEGEVLGKSQRHPRSDKAFDRRSISKTQKNGRVCQNARFFKRVDEKFCDVEFDPHSGKYHGELFFSRQYFGLSGYLSGNQVVRHTAAGKNRQLLATNQGIHPVNGRYASLDEVSVIFPAPGVYRQTIYVHHAISNYLRISIDGSSQAIEYPAKHIATHSYLERFSDECNSYSFH